MCSVKVGFTNSPAAHLVCLSFFICRCWPTLAELLLRKHRLTSLSWTTFIVFNTRGNSLRSGAPISHSRQDMWSSIHSGQRRKQQSFFHYTILSVCPFLSLTSCTSVRATCSYALFLLKAPRELESSPLCAQETSGGSHSRAASEGETIPTLFWQQVLCGEKCLKGPHN